MEVPYLFLSHSGAQKPFAWHLYQELLHVGHSVFFDQDAQDSLPKGHPFPPRIVQACRGCRIGIVILSDQYLESLWPMLELEQLTFHNPSSDCILYPLFYTISPGDLSNKEKLKQWQDTWKSKELEWQSKVQDAFSPSTSHLQISININRWQEALKRLKYQSGDVKDPNTDDRAYIQKVVSNICKTIPPPRARYLLEEHIKGMVRLQKEIDDLFQQALLKSGNSLSEVCSLGVWGLGGSGKTTLCKNMANFYRSDFPGRSCLLVLPTEKDEKQLVEAVKEVVLALGRAKKDEIEKISSVEVSLSHLEEGLKGHQVFLAIDNVWDWTIERAKQIVSMACIAGSKILVTSRSEQVLERLLPIWRNIIQVPSLTEDEAVEVLKCSSFCLPDVIPEIELNLKGLARLCFFEGQCHPLLLKMMGDALRRRGGRLNHAQGWKDLISRTGPMDDDESILKVLETSFLALTPKLKNTFIDLVTCTPPRYMSFKRKCKWLRMIHDGFTKMDMRDQLIELEYHGLLEINEGAYDMRQVSIHDLHKSLARRRAAGRADACVFLEEGIQSVDDKCRNTKCMVITGETRSEIIKVIMTHCSKLEILVLEYSYMSLYKEPGFHECTRLSVRSMQYLRYLELNACGFLEEIEGWEGTPNLVSLKLRECVLLQKLGNMGCLRKLEKLIITSESNRKYTCAVPDLTQCGELKKLVISGNEGLKHLASLGQPPKLKELNLSRNTNLEDARTVFTFTALRKLNLSWCRDLELINMEGMQVCPLTDLEELDLTGCGKLQRIPDLTNNVARLKVLKAGDGGYGTVKLGVLATTSLQVLELGRGWEQLRKLPSGRLCRGLELILCDVDGSCMSSQLQRQPNINGLMGSAFENLRELIINGRKCQNTSALDVSGLTSLEKCSLRQFPMLEEITGMDALRKLKQLFFMGCSLLKLELRFLGWGSTQAGGGASKQEEAMYIKASDVGDSSTPPPVFPTCLEKLTIFDCSSFTNASSLTTPLPNLKYLNLKMCPSLRELPELTHLTSLQYIRLDKSLDTPAVREQFCKMADFWFF